MTTAQRSEIETVALVSLGCPKNLVDSEKMLGLLAEDGLLPVADPAEADAVVINTCGFLEASKQESLDHIAAAAQLKQQGACKRVVVAGCLVQRHRAKLLDWVPHVDALIGVFDRDRIVSAVRGPSVANDASKTQSTVSLPVYSSIASSASLARKERGISGAGYHESDAARLRLTPRHFAYLRMSEGCNQNCAFCTIPSIRGKMRSKPVQAIAAEARELIQDGAFELNLIGQDTTSFGQDIDYAPGLVGLLSELDQLVQREAGGGWIRLMYAYPSCFTDQMIDAISQLPNVVKYIDMPLQHISDPVLDRMRRRTSRRLIEELLTKLRDRVPGLAIRTTFISGFPGETDQQHEELVKFVKDFGFDAMGVFGYSPEPGTPAGTMHAKGQAVPEQVIDARIEELMLAQQQVVFDRNEKLVQQQAAMDVLVESPIDPEQLMAAMEEAEAAGRDDHADINVDANVYPDADADPYVDTHDDDDADVALDDGDDPDAKAVPGGAALLATQGERDGYWYRGRHSGQAPEIDAGTFVFSEQPLSPGELVRCRVTAWDDYDLVALASGAHGSESQSNRGVVRLPVVQ